MNETSIVIMQIGTNFLLLLVVIVLERIRLRLGKLVKLMRDEKERSGGKE